MLFWKAGCLWPQASRGWGQGRGCLLDVPRAGSPRCPGEGRTLVAVPHVTSRDTKRGGEEFQQEWSLLWLLLVWRGEYALLLLLRVDTWVSTCPLSPLPVEQNPHCPFRPPVLLQRRGAPSQQGKAGHLSSLFKHETLVLGSAFVFYVCVLWPVIFVV